MTTLHITRAKGTWATLRNLHVVVDGQRVADLKPGQSTELPLAPGPHRVETKMDWTGSPPLEITAAVDETIDVELVPPGIVTGLVRCVVAPKRVFEARLVKRD